MSDREEENGGGKCTPAAKFPSALATIVNVRKYLTRVGNNNTSQYY
jgi:hypothetical protein